MDIAVLSDIHGNYIALERCIEYALSCNISTFIFLGDYIGEGNEQGKRKMKMNQLVVGNVGDCRAVIYRKDKTFQALSGIPIFLFLFLLYLLFLFYRGPQS